MLEKDRALELQLLAKSVRAAHHADGENFAGFLRELSRQSR